MKLKKLNNKGYLIVEIIVSAVLAMTIAFALISLTVKIKDKYEDTYVDSLLMTDKTIMTNEILSDLYSKEITKVDGVCDESSPTSLSDCSDKKAGLIFTISDNTTVAVIYDGTKLEYGSYEKNCFNEEGANYYSYTFDSRLVSKGFTESVKNDIATFKLPMETLYSDKDYGLTIVIPYTSQSST